MAKAQYSKPASRSAQRLVEKDAQQVAAMCVRTGADGLPLVLLITSRDTERWILPKGNIDRGEKPQQSAVREAFEEAGVSGQIENRPIGYYSYIKDGRPPPLLVAVYVIDVTAIADDFKEKGVRRTTWVSTIEATRIVDEPELKGLIGKLAITWKPPQFR